MKTIHFFMLCVIILSCAVPENEDIAQNHSEKEAFKNPFPNHITELGINGNVKEITESNFDYEAGKKVKFHESRTEFYTKEGWIEKISMSFKEDEVNALQFFEYNVNGLLIAEYMDSVHPSRLVMKYEYPDSNERLVVGYFKPSLTRDEFGTKSFVYYDADYKKDYTKEEALNPHYNSGRSHYFYDSLGFKRMYTYNQLTNEESGEIPSDSSCTIYDRGVEISRKSFSKGALTFIREMEYLEYDEQGNWTKAISTTEYIGKNMKYQSLHERTILYY